jgi:hypothetical protein
MKFLDFEVVDPINGNVGTYLYSSLHRYHSTYIVGQWGLGDSATRMQGKKSAIYIFSTAFDSSQLLRINLRRQLLLLSLHRLALGPFGSSILYILPSTLCLVFPLGVHVPNCQQLRNGFTFVPLALP